MKQLLNPIAVSGFILVSALGMLNAQITANFDIPGGYASGSLGAHSDWDAWTGNPADTNFIVDTSGSGTLTIDPSQGTWQSAKFVGPGGTLTSNNYFGEVRFTLTFSGTAITSGATALPDFTIRNTDAPGEQFHFALRHAPWNGQQYFNVFSVNQMNGSWDAQYINGFSPTAIGLALDESNTWTDGQSDELMLTFSMVHIGSNQWEESVTFTNLTTATEIGSVTRTVTDVDGSFASASSHFFEMNDDNLHVENVAVVIDSLSLTTVPESSTFALLTGLSALGLILCRRRLG